ncbi:hypothetical protein LCGC14_0480800 [marine sediment metagenome]|uniref:Uncharacterized protein n=1 Tax=marine sediment metagenome TaxID=412755 RepID=A0A0F9UWA9_9ZZZZ
METGYRLQKGGLGHGGKSITAHPATVNTLEYLGYIERGEYAFPMLHYRLKTVKPNTAMVLEEKDPVHGNTHSHPGFGSISFTKAQGGSTALFGSSIKHHNLIVLRISHAVQHRVNATDRVFSRGIIVEAYMSATQFANAMTAIGGGETPITLQFTEKDGMIDNLTFENKREQFEKEFQETAKGIFDRMAETIEKAKSRNVPRWLVQDMEITLGWLKANIPFLAEQFAAQMDTTVTEAKAEVEAYVSGIVQQTGLAALEEMIPQITEGKEGTDNA